MTCGRKIEKESLSVNRSSGQCLRVLFYVGSLLENQPRPRRVVQASVGNSDNEKALAAAMRVEPAAVGCLMTMNPSCSSTALNHQNLYRFRGCFTAIRILPLSSLIKSSHKPQSNCTDIQ